MRNPLSLNHANIVLVCCSGIQAGKTLALAAAIEARRAEVPVMVLHPEPVVARLEDIDLLPRIKITDYIAPKKNAKPPKVFIDKRRLFK